MLSSFCLVSLAISELININKVNYTEYTDLCSSNPSGISVHVWLAETGHVSCSTIRCFCSRPIGENRSRTLYCKVYYSSNPSSICVHAWLTRTSHVHCSAGHSTLQTHEVFLFTPDRLQFVTYTVLQSMTHFKPIRYLIGYSRSRSLQYRVLYCLNLSGIKILLIPDGVII